MNNELRQPHDTLISFYFYLFIFFSSMFDYFIIITFSSKCSSLLWFLFLHIFIIKTSLFFELIAKKRRRNIATAISKTRRTCNRKRVLPRGRK